MRSGGAVLLALALALGAAAAGYLASTAALRDRDRGRAAPPAASRQEEADDSESATDAAERDVEHDDGGPAATDDDAALAAEHAGGAAAGEDEHDGLGAGPDADAARRNREGVQHAEDGDLAAAIPLLREARRLAPTSELYTRNLQALLINAGFADIEASRFDVAVQRFVEALALGDRGEIRRGLGYAYYRLGQVDLARASLERAVDQGAGDATTFVTLGRIYLGRHDQTRALAALEQALAAGADAPGLAATVERLRRDAAAEEGFHSLASSHFVLKFEGRENTEAGRLVLNGLEEAYRKVGARFAYYPLDRLEVILYPDQTFREVTSSPHWSGAVYDGRIKIPIGGLQRGSERLLRTLRHEYAHAAIVTLSRGRAPVWLNEGLAQVAEETGDEGRGGRVRAALATDGLLSLAELESGFTRFDRTQASLAYAEAYFAAEYLLRFKGSYNVRRLLEAMGSAEGTDAAFRQALGLPYGEFERRFLAEVERRLG